MKSQSGSSSLLYADREEDLEEEEVDKLDFIDYITQLSKLESTHKIVYLNRVPFVVSMRVVRPFRNAITSEEYCVTTSNHCVLLNPQQKQLSIQDHQLPNQTTISLLNNFAANEQYYAGGDISNSCVLAGGVDGGRGNNTAAGSFTQSLANDVQQLKNVDKLNDTIKQQALRLLLTCTNGSDEYYEADLGFDDLQEHRKKISMNHISWTNYLQYLRNGLFIYKRYEKSAFDGVDDPSESDIVLQFDEENKESKDVIQLVIYSPLKTISQTLSSSDPQQSNHSQNSIPSSSTSSTLLNIRLKFLFELYAIRHISDFTQKLQQLLLDLVCHGNALSEIRALKDAKLISDLRNELQETRQKLRQAQDRLILYQPLNSTGHDSGGGLAATDDNSSSDQEQKNSSAPKRKATKSLLNPNQKKRSQPKGAKIQ